MHFQTRIKWNQIVTALRRRGFINLPGEEAYQLKNQSITESALTMMMITQFTRGNPVLIKSAVSYVLEYLWLVRDQDIPEEWIPEDPPQLSTIRRK